MWNQGRLKSWKKWAWICTTKVYDSCHKNEPSLSHHFFCPVDIRLRQARQCCFRKCLSIYGINEKQAQQALQVSRLTILSWLQFSAGAMIWLNDSDIHHTYGYSRCTVHMYICKYKYLYIHIYIQLSRHRISIWLPIWLKKKVTINIIIIIIMIVYVCFLNISFHSCTTNSE